MFVTVPQWLFAKGQRQLRKHCLSGIRGGDSGEMRYREMIKAGAGVEGPMSSVEEMPRENLLLRFICCFDYHSIFSIKVKGN